MHPSYRMHVFYAGPGLLRVSPGMGGGPFVCVFLAFLHPSYRMHRLSAGPGTWGHLAAKAPKCFRWVSWWALRARLGKLNIGFAKARLGKLNI